MADGFVTPKELQERGYLLEANRLFFHPLGMALGVDVAGGQTIDDAHLVVLDARDDAEGYVFSDLDDRDRALAHQVQAERDAKAPYRTALFGAVVQPLEQNGEF